MYVNISLEASVVALQYSLQQSREKLHEKDEVILLLQAQSSQVGQMICAKIVSAEKVHQIRVCYGSMYIYIYIYSHLKYSSHTICYSHVVVWLSHW